jgi:hypothetical protein
LGRLMEEWKPIATAPKDGREILEPISKSSEEDEEAGELHEAKEVLRIKLPADK